MAQNELPEEPATASPLAGLASQTLDELMSRDPLSLAEADLEKIVQVLREQRKRWLVEAQIKPVVRAAPKAPTTKRAASAADVADLMKDLGL